MQINGIEYKVAPCPLCGNKKPEVFDFESYSELLEEKGKAAIDIQCMNCFIDVWELNDKIRDYDEKVETLIRKWNKLCGGKNYADKKD